MNADETLIVHPDDPEYLLLAAAEAAFWSKQHPAGMESWEEQLTDGPADLYGNERFTGSTRVHWYETIQHQGDFRRGLILGTSGLRSEATILRTNPRLHVTFADISEGALERRQQTLGRQFPGRVATMIADFNFLDLSPASFDVIISSSSIHHITNLEHAAAQIGQALTDEGLFFLHDYVGEPRFNFAPEKRRMFELLSERDYRRASIAPQPVHWFDASDLSPLCGVRSNEILPIFGRVLLPEDVRIVGALLVPLLRTTRANREPPLRRLERMYRRTQAAFRRVTGRPRKLRRNWIEERFLKELMLVGELLADAGVIQPGNAFGVYRKRHLAGVSAVGVDVSAKAPSDM